MSESTSNPALEAFLAAGQAADTPSPPASEIRQSQEPPPEPASPSPTKTAPEAASSAPAQPEADDPDDGSGTVPLAAHRKAREDWKGRHERLAGEAAELRRQLDALQRPPPPQPTQAQPAARQPPPDPARDPQAYHAWMQAERVNDKLDTSEVALRRVIGADAVRQLQDEFRQAAETDKTLWGKLYAAQDPYEWAHQWVQQQRVLREVGTDPDGYRNKLRAELEAEIRAQLGQGVGGPQQPPQSPAAGIPPSLATVRSGAPRGQTFSGPPAIEDIVGRRSGDNFARR